MNTKIYLASAYDTKNAILPFHETALNMLESFVNLRRNTPKNQEFVKWALTGSFMLDSGAFTFINQMKKKGEFSTDGLKDYIDDFINFINFHDLELFFEMDIDAIVGYENVKLIRQYIEEGTGKKPIPVWHRSRGIEEFHQMCKDYKYVAVGGIAIREIKSTEYDFLCELCDIAHSYGCKIHGLGYSPLKVLNERKCPFDSIDSTSWIGNKYGTNYKCEDGKLIKYKRNGEHWKPLCRHCYEQWGAFSKLPDVYKEEIG